MRNDLLRQLQQVADPAAGYVASHQAVRAGVDERALGRARQAGLLVPVRRGVGRLASAPVHPHEPLHAAVLALPGSCATRWSALQLHGPLPSLPQPRPHVAVVGNEYPRLAKVRIHTTRRLEAEDVTIVNGTRTEVFGRAVISTIGDPAVHWIWVARLLDAACRLWDDRALDEVQEALDRAGARGHSGAAILRRLVAERRETGPRDGFALQRRWMSILNRAGLTGHDEFHVVVEGGDRWIDRAFVDVKVGVEVKGHSVHGSRAAFDADADREEALAACGWLIFPITSRSDPDTVVRRLRAAIAARTAGRSTPPTCR
ncbi:MAG: hypothetical protein WKF86_01620 [Acidimicrobiales bacterium]